MILTSTLSGQQLFWIKVPRTATHSFEELFKKYNTHQEETVLPIEADKHNHFSYNELCAIYDKKLNGVSVVRHPLDRFVSILKYLFSKYYGTSSSIKSLWESTDSCIEFLNLSFHRNCQPVGYDVSTLFIDCETEECVKNCNALFKTQAFYAYTPKVKIFHYEQLHEFTDWIKTHLGYDITEIPRINASCKSIKMNVDFNHPEFIKTVENLYYIDYKVFGYSLQYLQ